LLAKRYLDRNEIREVLAATPVAAMPVATAAGDQSAQALPQSVSPAL